MEQLAPPLQIVAGGICPQGLSAGDKAPNTCRCRAVNAGTGTWQVTPVDPSLDITNSVLIAFPGNGSNIAGGVSFGQSTRSGSIFLFESYRDDTGAPVDVECHFIIVKFPPGT